MKKIYQKTRKELIELVICGWGIGLACGALLLFLLQKMVN